MQGRCTVVHLPCIWKFPPSYQSTLPQKENMQKSDKFLLYKICFFLSVLLCDYVSILWLKTIFLYQNHVANNFFGHLAITIDMQLHKFSLQTVFCLFCIFLNFFCRQLLLLQTKLRRAKIVKVGVATDSLPMAPLILLGNEDEEDAWQRGWGGEGVEGACDPVDQPDWSRSWNQLSPSCCCYVFGLLIVDNQQLHVQTYMVLEVISKANT